MEVRQIMYVLEVARQKNFSKAAQALYITQPTISQQIRNLESELGIKIFTRDTHNVILTPDGEKFCEYGQKVIDALDELMSSFGQGNSSNKTILKIGVYTFYKATGLARDISRFIMDNANVMCDVNIYDNYGIYERIKNDELSFGIIKSRPDHIKSELEHIELLSNDRLMLIASAKSEYADREYIDASELGELNLAIGSKTSHHYVETQELYRQNNSRMKVSFQTDDPDMMLNLISQGFTSMMATQSVADAIDNDGIAAIPINPPQYFSTYLVYKKGRKLTGTEKAFIAYIKNTYGIED